MTMDQKLKDKFMTSVLSGRNTESQLISLYNKLEPSKMNHEDFEELVQAIEMQLRDKFPRAATRIFGAKDKKAINTLESFLTTLDFDRASNKIGNNVKTGGGKINGKCYIQNYISYKNSSGQKVELLLEQKTLDSELLAYIINRPIKGQMDIRTPFKLSEIDDAKNMYKELLSNYVNKT